ncbi:acetyltransferase, GNAT family [Enterococcus hermanniensis]|uniref:Acetyltransferase, GNAT family n=2 Tax=Enterococcus hermanniensis TaxID=249189 RepID=A0A1L8TMG4_9ENTE|nr:acetyltransferase, GNAT family [Enterococcus hermanniensis]
MQEFQRNGLRKLYLVSRRRAFYWQDPAEFKLADFDNDTLGEKVLVAVEEDKIIGFISIYLEDSFIHCLFVDPNKVGLGIGTLLLEQAKKQVNHQMSLKCLSKNQSGLSFYLKRGWKVLDEITFENKDENYLNLVYKIK